MKVALVYYSQTGNTEAMANIIENALNGQAECSIIAPEAFTIDNVSEYDAIAFGCPAMGVEVLEEEVFEPMFASLEASLSGKKIALFGSYGWGDGEWMRAWAERAASVGAVLVCDPVICQEAPDEETEAALTSLAASLLS